MVENEFIIGQNSTNFIVHKGDWENSAVFTYIHNYFLKINSVTIQIVNDIENIWCSTQISLLHFLYCISPKILLQYFNKLEFYWNIAIYCNNSINCNLLQYKSIKRRSGNSNPKKIISRLFKRLSQFIFFVFLYIHKKRRVKKLPSRVNWSSDPNKFFWSSYYLCYSIFLGWI